MNQTESKLTYDLPKSNLSTTFSTTTVGSKQVTFAKRPQSISHIYEGNNIVKDYLESIVLQKNWLKLVGTHKILFRQDHELMVDKVKILTGGSARLEPLYSGFVGPGMLTASVFGEISSSPSYLSVLAALRLLSKGHAPGILVIVTNNIADRLNFGLACQQALREGIKTMCLTVGEDCSGVLVDKTVGRRGLSGVLFLYKVAGAMSEEKKTIYEIYCLIRGLKNGLLGTVNVGIEQDGMVIGSGLKGEPGKFSHHKLISLIVNEALFYIFHPASYFSLHVKQGDNIALLVNNLGKLSDFHLTLITKEVVSRINILGINVVRIYSGRFLTTKVVGFSVSVLKVNDNVVHYLDGPVCVISWPTKTSEVDEVPMSLKRPISSYSHSTDSSMTNDSEETESTMEEKNIGPRFSSEQASLLVAVLETVVTAVTNMEEYLNKLDFDHDYGTNIKKLMRSIRIEMSQRALNITTPYGMFNNLAELAATSMGGVSGAIFSVLFSAAAQAFLTSSQHSRVGWRLWMEAGRMARDSLCAFTHVRPGYRTVLDALHPFVEAFTKPSVLCLTGAVQAAMVGAESTAGLTGVHRNPDPGAYCLAVALRVAFTELQIDLVSLEVCSLAEQLDWFCSPCVQQLQAEGVSFCESCLRIMNEELAEQ